MTKSNNDIFLDFWRSYQWPEIKPVMYRLYHDDSGRPIVYSMEELPHKFVELTAEEFGRHNYQVRVVQGKLIPCEHKTFEKLVPTQGVGTTCHPNDVTIVVASNQENQTWALSNDQEN
jgi:hypothetical protein